LGLWENKNIIYYGKIYFVLPELAARHEFANTEYAVVLMALARK
jgi:hypothetical protein